MGNHWIELFRRAKQEKTLDIMYSRALASINEEGEKDRINHAHDQRLNEIIAKQF